MYSRLYTHILNHFPQIDHCASFHHIYTDSSLFGLFASFIPSSGRQANSPAHILPHLVHQLSLLLYSNIPQAELSRAKNQLKSSLMMALESRAVEVEDLGRQVRCQTSASALFSDPKTGARTWTQGSCVRDVREDRRGRQHCDPPRRCACVWTAHHGKSNRGSNGSRGCRRLPWCVTEVRPCRCVRWGVECRTLARTIVVVHSHPNRSRTFATHPWWATGSIDMTRPIYSDSGKGTQSTLIMLESHAPPLEDSCAPLRRPQAQANDVVPAMNHCVTCGPSGLRLWRSSADRAARR